MELYVADAFTTRRFSGNQAGVALLGTEDFPEEGLMRALAGELKHSETAFVRRTGEKSFHIRYFTPAGQAAQWSTPSARWNRGRSGSGTPHTAQASTRGSYPSRHMSRSS